jgi:hypothetical protein
MCGGFWGMQGGHAGGACRGGMQGGMQGGHAGGTEAAAGCSGFLYCYSYSNHCSMRTIFFIRYTPVLIFGIGCFTPVVC